MASDKPDWLSPSPDKVRAQIHALLRAWGFSETQASFSADVMVDTDLSGVDSHGVSMLVTYNQFRHSGQLNLNAEPKVVNDRGVTALLDADAGLGHAAAVMGMKLAIEKAQTHGVGMVCVRNSHHFGAAGYYVRMAAQAGMIGLCTSATRSINTVPTRGRLALLGTNPIAFAAPARRHPPFVLDMASSSVAANKVKVYELRGDEIPPGWVLDQNAEPVTDASQAMDILFARSNTTGKTGGGLAPLGGTPEMSSHKGYGLAMMVHILAGTLSGASFSPIRNKTQRPNDPDDLGHFFCAIDPATFRDPEDFKDDLDAAIDVLHETPAADPSEPVLVHGELEEQSRRTRQEKGIPMPPALVQQLRVLCEEARVPFTLV